MPPVGDLCLVDGEAVVVGCREAWCLVDGAVDVGDHPARAADHVVVVVADAGLVPRDRAEGLDAAHQPGVGQGPQRVVDRLVRDVRELAAYRADDRVGVGVRGAGDGSEHGHPRSRHPQPGAAQPLLPVGIAVGVRAHPPIQTPFPESVKKTRRARQA